MKEYKPLINNMCFCPECACIGNLKKYYDKKYYLECDICSSRYELEDITKEKFEKLKSHNIKLRKTILYYSMGLQDAYDLFYSFYKSYPVREDNLCDWMHCHDLHCGSIEELIEKEDDEEYYLSCDFCNKNYLGLLKERAFPGELERLKEYRKWFIEEFELRKNKNKDYNIFDLWEEEHDRCQAIFKEDNYLLDNLNK